MTINIVVISDIEFFFFSFFGILFLLNDFFLHLLTLDKNKCD